MADISVECPSCSRQFTVSEYIDSSEVPCPGCGTMLGLDIGSDSGGLKLQERGAPVNEEKPAPVVEAPVETETDLDREVKEKLKHSEYQAPEKKGIPPFIIQSVLFTACFGLFIFLQIKGSQSAEYMGVYKTVRVVAFPIILIWGIVVAFQETAIQGIVCAIFPPYLLFYILGKCDVPQVRGVFLAMIVAMATELNYFPEHSVVRHLETTSQSIVDWGQDNIQRAGEADLEKL